MQGYWEKDKERRRLNKHKNKDLHAKLKIKSERYFKQSFNEILGYCAYIKGKNLIKDSV